MPVAVAGAIRRSGRSWPRPTSRGARCRWWRSAATLNANQIFRCRRLFREPEPAAGVGRFVPVWSRGRQATRQALQRWTHGPTITSRRRGDGRYPAGAGAPGLPIQRHVRDSSDTPYDCCALWTSYRSSTRRDTPMWARLRLSRRGWVAALALGVTVPAASRVLIPASRRAHRFAPSEVTAIRPAVLLAPITARADEHLAPTPGTQKQPGIVHRRPRRGGLDDPQSPGNTALGSRTHVRTWAQPRT